MIIIHGVYRFAPKRRAFRNDFCLTCKANWIPLLPLGVWKKRVCSVCGRDPHVALSPSGSSHPEPIRSRSSGWDAS